MITHEVHSVCDFEVINAGDNYQLVAVEVKKSGRRNRAILVEVDEKSKVFCLANGLEQILSAISVEY